jgi:hypothetical protein
MNASYVHKFLTLLELTNSSYCHYIHNAPGKHGNGGRTWIGKPGVVVVRDAGAIAFGEAH